MPIPNQKFRELVFLGLYSRDLGQGEEEEMIPLLMHELAVTKKAVKASQIRAGQVLSKLTEIDACITEASQSYAFERIQVIERNIIRLGVFELLYDKTIPEKVAIAEALRLTKKFGTPASCAFVNAILDNIYQRSQGGSLEQAKIQTALEELLADEKISHQTAINSQDPKREKLK